LAKVVENIEPKYSNDFKLLFKVSKLDVQSDVDSIVEDVNKIPENMKKEFNDYIMKFPKQLLDLNKNRIKINSIKYNGKYIEAHASSENPVDDSLKSDVEVISDKSIYQVIDNKKGSDGFEYNFDSVKVS
jgi:hypothetical protein